MENKNTIFRWGVIGPGTIAHSFAKAVAGCPDACISAVASHNHAKAVLYAHEYHIPTVYDNYEKLVADREIDAIYVANTNPFHYESIIMCLNEKKPVLCEKPMVLNTTQMQNVISLARKNKVFLMEALWSRFLPIYRVVDQWIESGKIGEILMLKADFGFRRPEWKENARHIDPQNGGGALLDVGVYNIALACKYLGNDPIETVSCLTKFNTGTDDKSVVLLRYENERMAVLTNSLNVMMPHDAEILGSEGSIILPFHWRGQKATLIKYDQPFYPRIVESSDMDFEGQNGYQYEVMHAIKCIREGITESPMMTLEDSRAICKIMTDVRKAGGIRYPGFLGE